ncbi:MAG: Gfo/Idh/MocA family oxidoreductase [Candidatus Latescibacteria bacterium]|nr:Gfo/Idh/MocA family oxidoreductase [Candidatus Latescibacterota bacterium]
MNAKKVGWGVVGAGGIADRKTIPGLLEAKNAKLVAVMSMPNESTDELAKKYGVRGYYTEQALLADPAVDAVYIATPVYLHHKQAIMAAEAGKHLLIEKPLAIGVPEGQAVVDACRKAGVKACEGYMMRFHTLNLKAKEMVDDGLIGNVVMGRAQLSCWYPDMPGAWRQDPKLGGGGTLMDLASHCYDLLEMYIGPIQSVMALVNTQTFQYSVEDSSTTLLEFKSGAHGIADCFFNVPDGSALSRLELYGNKGSILLEGTIGQAPGGRMIAYLSDDAREYDPMQNAASLGVERREITVEPKDMYTAEIEHLSDCILNDREPEVNRLEHGLGILSTVMAAYESGRTGKKVRL